MKVGVVGGGQLAQMLALAGIPLGLEFVFLDPKSDTCAARAGEHLQGEYDDKQALGALADRCDVATYDFENVPVSSAEHLERRVPVFPPSQALAASQDRLTEKSLFTRFAIPTPEYQAVDSREQLREATGHLGFPCVLKTRRFGYDGKGQALLKSDADVDAVWEQYDGQSLILERFVEFRRELSVVAVRGADGKMAFYPLTENRHKNGILSNSLAPASAGRVADQAREYARTLMEHFNYVGTYCLELFENEDGLLANEMAPRVHNSGHWTIEGAETSQFENHLRAIMGWPLGSTAPVGYSAMINWIGALPDPAQGLSSPGVHWHDYGKTPRDGRKVGHVTLRAEDLMKLQSMVGSFALALGKQFAAGVETFKR